MPGIDVAFLIGRENPAAAGNISIDFCGGFRLRTPARHSDLDRDGTEARFLFGTAFAKPSLNFAGSILVVMPIWTVAFRHLAKALPAVSNSARSLSPDLRQGAGTSDKGDKTK
ncbi:MAG: hypothetical protein ACK4PC_07700 [Sphingopyxis sp.]